MQRLSRRPWRAALSVVAVALLAAGCGSNAPMATVPSVDVDRFLGIWYEAAVIPNFFQRMCVSDTQARYRRDGEGLEVYNRCRDADGRWQSATGRAEVVPGSGNAKLRVTFLRPFWGDYWVLAFGPDERWALVGEPGRRYGWVLSRTPALPAADLQAALDRAQALGYDRAEFKTTRQTGEP